MYLFFLSVNLLGFESIWIRIHMDILGSWIRNRMKTYADPKHWFKLETKDVRGFNEQLGNWLIKNFFRLQFDLIVYGSCKTFIFCFSKDPAGAGAAFKMRPSFGFTWPKNWLHLCFKTGWWQLKAAPQHWIVQQIIEECFCLIIHAHQYWYTGTGGLEQEPL